MKFKKHHCANAERRIKPPAKRQTPPEFRRLALNCRPFKEIAAEYEAGRFDDWNTALSAAVFVLANELEAARRKSTASQGTSV
jgi:hypothetical protein